MTNEERLIKMSQFLKTASDPTRLKILSTLLNEKNCRSGGLGVADCSNCYCQCCMIEKRVSDIVLEINESQSLVSHQLKTLKKADFVKDRKEGTSIYYSLKDGHVKELLRLVKEHVEELRK